MTVLCASTTIPSNGSQVQIFASTPENSNSLFIRNTGTVTVLLGSSGNELFPLQANEFLGIQVAPDDILYAVVQTNGTAGQITVLGMN